MAFGEEAAPEAGADGTVWSEPILFYPDGTASDATVVLENEYRRRIELTLRGLTGVATVGELYETEEVLR
jgi:hypothetical protein